LSTKESFDDGDAQASLSRIGFVVACCVVVAVALVGMARRRRVGSFYMQ